MLDGFVLAQDLAAGLIAKTKEVWRQRPGTRAEPLDHAWKRLFKAPMGVPVMFATCRVENRDVVVRLYARGRVAVIDPWNGASIRTVNRKAREHAVNISDALAAFDPMTAHFQSHGRPVFAGNSTQHHGRMAGATHNFLK